MLFGGSEQSMQAVMSLVTQGRTLRILLIIGLSINQTKGTDSMNSLLATLMANNVFFSYL